MTKKEFIKKYKIKTFLVSLVLTLFSALMYTISMAISKDYHYINMSIDNKIPFIKYFVIPYCFYFFMPTLSLYLLSFFNMKKFKRLVIVSIIGIVIANIVFNIYQVKMVTANVTGNDIFSKLIKFIYSAEEPLNCFPSLHAFFGTSVVITLIDEKKCPIWMRIVVPISGVLIIMSTVFIKQHYFIDALAGVLMMILLYTGAIIIEKIIEKKKMGKTSCEEC